jgi:hypothetical protein
MPVEPDIVVKQLVVLGMVLCSWNEYAVLCQGRSKTRPAGRSKNRPLRWWEGLICQDRQGGLERRPALPLGGAFRPERKVPLPIAASCRVG